MTLDPALRERIDTLLHGNRVVLFMKGRPDMPQCGFSAKATGLLSGLGVDFAHVDVLADQEIREGIKAYGNWPTIPQLYIDGELVGGSDIIEEMANSGELNQALGLPPVDRTPPRDVTVTPAAAQMLRQALADAGAGTALALAIDARFQPRFQIAAAGDDAIAVECEGVRIQFDPASARRADGITIDWVDDIRGKGLAIDNPNAPKPVQALTPAEADARVRAGTLTLVDVRPPEERAQASLNTPFEVLDGDARRTLEALPKDTPLAFLCHTGQRSREAAEHFRGLGFGGVYNVEGGIEAWAQDVDASIPRY
ncbi:Grx4 family monothiol glutaredoxin [Luteimonas salinilitoris]|uniref:Grx4 family monothiol glutaredoxin n=1 Tax=Luteimonas salinilitoris TaxID=3237697 RepID=A0ABV4HSJ2_9GAMM